MRRLWTFVGLAVAMLLLSALPAVGQDLKAGQTGSRGPVTSEASKKIVSRLRGLMTDFRTGGITSGNARQLDAAGRFSSTTLKVDSAGRVQVYVSVTDTSGRTLDVLHRHGLNVEVVNSDFSIVQGWVAGGKPEGLGRGTRRRKDSAAELRNNERW